jgi:hypothetical protein
MSCCECCVVIPCVHWHVLAVSGPIAVNWCYIYCQLYLWSSFPTTPALRWTAVDSLPPTEGLRVLHTWREQWTYASGVRARERVNMLAYLVRD